MALFSATRSLVAFLALLTVAAIVYRAFLAPRKPKVYSRLPPGPKPAFLVGNVADLPPAAAKEWIYWAKHKALYGPISSLTVLGQTLVILNDYNIAVELMEKRSATNSSRPKMVFGGEMSGWENTLAMITYSDRSRAYRKAIHAKLGTSSAIDEFRPLFEVDVRRFLVRLLEKPGGLLQHIRTQAGSIILKIGYGYTIEPHTRDPLVDLADEALDQFSKACVPGVWMVDIMPFLKHLPDWLPCTGFKRTARHWKATITSVADKPYAFVEDQLRNGTAQPSYLSKLLESSAGPLSHEADHVARWSAASLYTGGADTTVSSMSCFFLAMMMYPSVQRKAHAEIDSVIGTSRLPTFSDRKSLPYIDAIVKEVLRWHPVAPMGLPHMTTKDDTYDKYFIPKGTLLLPNIWEMLHDPEVYRDPDAFKPERFLGENPEPDPHSLSFGFGRRICPGKVLADATLFLSIADSLAVFDIGKVVENGKEVDPVVDFLPGVISHPRPYKCDIRARSAAHEKLIRSVEVEHPWPEHGDARYLDGEVAGKP